MAYPSPPPFTPSRTPSLTFKTSSIGSMGGNGTTNVDGVGALNYQRALDIARNTEGDLDPSVREYLENALGEIWSRIQQHPESYVLSKDEFAVFNFYIQRFDGAPEAESAIARYWHHAQQESTNYRTQIGSLTERIKLVQMDTQLVATGAINGQGALLFHPRRSSGTGRVLSDPSSAKASAFRGAFGAMGRRTNKALSTTASLVLILVSIVGAVPPSGASSVAPTTLRSHARQVSSTLLEVFQVYPPVLTVTPSGILEITDGSSNATVDIIDDRRTSCQQTIVQYSFANSYGAPFVSSYVPPSCAFNRVTWNLTVVTAGRQFDRLGIVYLGDIEVFRTSTAEPTAAGIQWTYLKDMTSFLSLLKADQKIIFDLGNIVNDIYTAAINVTITAAYFNAEDSITPADLILAVSSHQSAANSASVFTVPSDTASSVLTLPRNVKKAVFTVAATGQSDEEFWWSNVPQSAVDTFGAGFLYGYSPFREVQLFIDGKLAGVSWPFPIIFTGGIVPGLWRPIVGIDAFDLQEDEIDITPWLPLLCDGNSHNFTIRISGLNDNGNGTATLSETTDDYWLVTGKVFVWLDVPGSITTGHGPYAVTPSPNLQVSSTIGTGANGTNETLYYSVSAERSLSVESTLYLSQGAETATWRQSRSFTNTGNFTDQGNVELNIQQTTGYDVSSSGYARAISYPLYALSTYATIADNISYVANVNRGKDVKTIGQPVFPTGLESFVAAEGVHFIYPSFEGASLSTTQNGTASYFENTTTLASFSFGSTEQDMTFSGISIDGRPSQYGFPSISATQELFKRQAAAVNGSVTLDHETLVNEPIEHTHGWGPGGSGQGLLLSPSFTGHGSRSRQHRMRRRQN
ncbi:hypothetical protein LTR62_007291 [Meristemomyces frigidus]|uniref:Peptide N-acetyl-beta-D-glucosaminyl asparaginase amidase A N-terminal domain-containing protein n=1 Tax=Meristemomyces frigidus TaxID=1508187 RepID=A0AAN7TPK9_9PEZI|nr:hypothetical protein LTR62_007291 [Meristemomyces frigidus]